MTRLPLLPHVRTDNEVTFIVHTFGGLGNQLFQYAAGRYYGQQHGARVVLAVEPPRDAISRGHPRPFLLSHFTIAAPYREMTKTEQLLQSTISAPQWRKARLAKALRATFGFRTVAEHVDQQFCFLPQLAIPKRTAAVNLIGYWQVHNIAESIADELRSELIFKTPPTGQNLVMQKRIQRSPNAVSVHIRRGDYLTCPNGSLALHISYYRRAIERIKSIIVDPEFFVFSDDADFARSHFAQDLGAVVVDFNDEFAADEDLRLMSTCRHHIIANSTFSWWGAWLNPRRDKLVLAPRTWRTAKVENIIPATWHTID